MKKFFENLQQKSYSTRYAILVVATVILGLPIFLFWLFSFRSEITSTVEIQKKNPAQASIGEESSGFVPLGQLFKDAVSSIGKPLKDFLEGFNIKRPTEMKKSNQVDKDSKFNTNQSQSFLPSETKKSIPPLELLRPPSR